MTGTPSRLQDGLEGIVSKRLGSRYRFGRSPDWLKFKNPEAPAVKREVRKIGGGNDGRERAGFFHRCRGAATALNGGGSAVS